MCAISQLNTDMQTLSDSSYSQLQRAKCWNSNASNRCSPSKNIEKLHHISTRERHMVISITTEIHSHGSLLYIRDFSRVWNNTCIDGTLYLMCTNTPCHHPQRPSRAHFPVEIKTLVRTAVIPGLPTPTLLPGCCGSHPTQDLGEQFPIWMSFSFYTPRIWT